MVSLMRSCWSDFVFVDFGRVDQMPCFGCFIFPFSVAGDGGK